MTALVKRRLSAAVLALVLAGCGLSPLDLDPFNSTRSAPLSKVSVLNRTSDWVYVRMNWPDGFVQVARVEPGAPQYLGGAIGTSGFPRTLDVLGPDCRELASVDGLAPGSAGLLTIEHDAAHLDPIHFGDTTWVVARGVLECGATE